MVNIQHGSMLKQGGSWTLLAKNLSNDLSRIKDWAFQWKMSFNPDPNKQVQEVFFLAKYLKLTHWTSLIFNNNTVTQSFTQKHLEMFLNARLDFQENLKNIFSKINKTISLLRKLPHNLPWSTLLTIYKSSIRPHLGYGDIIHGQTYDALFHPKLEFIQYNSAQAITGAIRGTLKEKLYNELGLETLEKRRWYRKVCCNFEILRYQCLKYLFNVIPMSVSTYNKRNINYIPLFKLKHYFHNSFFLSAVTEWNKDTNSQFKKLECILENSFEVHTSPWKQCLQCSWSQMN